MFGRSVASSSFRKTPSVRWFCNARVATSSSSWITDYSNMPVSTRYDVIQRIVLPSLSASAKATGDDDNNGVLPGPIAQFYRELSRHKGSLTTSMQLRDDIMTLMKSKGLAESLPLLCSGKEDDKTVKGQLKHLDKIIQSYLQTSLLCYDSMELRRIEFETSSGILLERIARGESVHRVRSLHELKRRLHDGKRCFGLFHNALKEDPLVFIHVGLTTNLSPSLR